MEEKAELQRQEEERKQF
jgi:hypothetical protein